MPFLLSIHWFLFLTGGALLTRSSPLYWPIPFWAVRLSFRKCICLTFRRPIPFMVLGPNVSFSSRLFPFGSSGGLELLIISSWADSFSFNLVSRNLWRCVPSSCLNSFSVFYNVSVKILNCLSCRKKINSIADLSTFRSEEPGLLLLLLSFMIGRTCNE